MHIRIAIFCLFFILASDSAPISAQLKKIRFSTTSIAVTELQFRIAQMKGFYREEGLDLETLLIRGSVGMQALIGGALGLPADRVGIKATTTEQMGFTGRREGIAAMATALVFVPVE